MATLKDLTSNPKFKDLIETRSEYEKIFSPLMKKVKSIKTKLNNINDHICKAVVENKLYEPISTLYDISLQARKANVPSINLANISLVTVDDKILSFSDDCLLYMNTFSRFFGSKEDTLICSDEKLGIWELELKTGKLTHIHDGTSTEKTVVGFFNLLIHSFTKKEMVIPFYLQTEQVTPIAEEFTSIPKGFFPKVSKKELDAINKLSDIFKTSILSEVDPSDPLAELLCGDKNQRDLDDEEECLARRRCKRGPFDYDA